MKFFDCQVLRKVLLKRKPTLPIYKVPVVTIPNLKVEYD